VRPTVLPARRSAALAARTASRPAILSGDRPAAVVKALARRLGISLWRAELSPRDKVDAVAELDRGGSKVLMVGDGINDAPALAAAHVSIAPATAADVGRQAADFVFMHESLNAVPLAIEVSRRAGRLIRQNFALAIGYNIIAVPIAACGLCDAPDCRRRHVDFVHHCGGERTSAEQAGWGGAEADHVGCINSHAWGGASGMNMLVYLIPIALLLGGLGLVAFLWSLKSGQYDDLDGAAWRAIDDDDDRPAV
jgi:cbb3-type cytochrome oxidase maturation protein